MFSSKLEDRKKGRRAELQKLTSTGLDLRATFLEQVLCAEETRAWLRENTPGIQSKGQGQAEGRHQGSPEGRQQPSLDW